MLSTILAYVLSFVAMVLLASTIGSLVLLPFTPIVRRFNFLATLCFFLSSAVGMIAALAAFAWVCSLMDVQPTMLMVLLPFVGVLKNDLDRIRQARRGATPVRTSLEIEGENYDSGLQVKMEYGYLYGDIAGVLLMILALRPLPFL